MYEPAPVVILAPRRHRQAEARRILDIPLSDWACDICSRQLDDQEPIMTLGSYALCSSPCGEELWLQPIRCCQCHGCFDHGGYAPG